MRRLSAISTLVLLTLALLPAAFAGPQHADHHAVNDGRGYLGVSLTFVQNVDVGKHENGVYINDVIPATGAEAAGLKAHDRIVAVNGTAVKSYAELHEAMGPTRPNDSVSVTFDRDGSEQTVSITLGEQPEHGAWAVDVHKSHDGDGRWAVASLDTQRDGGQPSR